MLKHHLVPKSRGFWLALEGLRDRLDAVYDVTVAYDDGLINDGKRRSAPQIASNLLSNELLTS